MNRIVREHYPAAKLPEDLREGLAMEACVKVVVEYDTTEPDLDAKRPLSLDEIFAMARPSFTSMDEVADHIRSIREEWD